MNKFILCSSVCLMLAFGSAGFADEHFPFLAKVKRGPVNVRAGANTNFEIIDKLNQGDQVVVLAHRFEWYKVKLAPKAAAFVRADYVNALSESAGEIIGNKVNIRVKADSISSVVGQLNSGDKVVLKAKLKDWWQIAAPESAAGWMHQDFVTHLSDEIPTEQLISSPAPVVEKTVPLSVSIQGVLTTVLDPQQKPYYQILVNDKPAYVLKDANGIERFKNSMVYVEGTTIDHNPSALPSACPIISVQKISVIL